MCVCVFGPPHLYVFNVCLCVFGHRTLGIRKQTGTNNKQNPKQKQKQGQQKIRIQKINQDSGKVKKKREKR